MIHHPHPEPGSDLEPNHDLYPDVTAMTVTILDTTMTGDKNPHTARQAPGGNEWEVSWLSGQTLDRDAATAAMILDDTIGGRDVGEPHWLWPHIRGWASELGLTATDAITRADPETEP